jgi:hypothetical protein
MNSLFHGLHSKLVVLPHESQKAFDALIKRYIKDFQPLDAHQLSLVHDLAVTRWKQRRIWNLENEMMDAVVPRRYAWNEEAPEHSAPGDLTHTIPDEETRAEDALFALLGNRKFMVLQEHEMRLASAYSRLLQRLMKAQKSAAKNNCKTTQLTDSLCKS